MKKGFLQRSVCVLCAAVFAVGLLSGFEEADGTDDNMDFFEEGVVVTEAEVMEIPARSSILMDAASGRVLFEQNADEPMPPASITKIMTLLLTFEALESGTLQPGQMVVASENAASMGGTQIWLEPGEEMALEDVIKATAVNSANDAAMALAEAVAGSETVFVQMMNDRAAELGMKNTHFVNPTGLDADGHLSTARDIALMSRALMEHEEALAYTSIWMDSLRGGETALVNTNKLVRFYSGCVGLKTGTTDGAGSCLSAAATRNGLSLIAVSMGSDTSAERFTACRTLLDYGFSAFESYVPEVLPEELTPVKVSKGVASEVPIVCGEVSPVLIPKGRGGDVQKKLTLEAEAEAPVQQGQVMGKAVFTLDGEVLYEMTITAAETVGQMDFWTAFKILWQRLLG